MRDRTTSYIPAYRTSYRTAPTHAGRPAAHAKLQLRAVAIDVGRNVGRTISVMTMISTELPPWPAEWKLSRADKLEILEFIKALAASGEIPRDEAEKILPYNASLKIRKYGLMHSVRAGSRCRINAYRITILGRAWLRAVTGE